MFIAHVLYCLHVYTYSSRCVCVTASDSVRNNVKRVAKTTHDNRNEIKRNETIRNEKRGKELNGQPKRQNRIFV